MLTAGVRRVTWQRARAGGALAAVMVAGVLLVGCAPGDQDAASTPTPSSSAEPSPSASTSPSPSQSASPGPADPSSTEGPTTAAPLPTEQAALDEPIALDDGMTIEITSVSAITVTAETPGEVDGPAVSVAVTATNESAAALAVDSAVVTLVADDGTLGIPTTAGGSGQLEGTLDPGAAASATYVFMLDPASGRTVTVSVNYGPGAPVAEFTGQIS